MGYVDADAHVLENEDTWEYFDPAEREYRPITLEYLGVDGPGAQSRRLYYLIGGCLSRRFPPESQTWGYGKNYTEDISYLRDPSARLREMDETGVDVQVIYTTSFLTVGVEHARAEAAVTRSYNRWMAERTADSGGRLRWVVVAPTLTIERAIEEMKFGKAHGAVGVMMKSEGEHGRALVDPYFHPLYELAEDLDMTICIHAGRERKHFEGIPYPFDMNYRSPTSGGAHSGMIGFWAVHGSDLHNRFPRLRWAFVELGAMWVPAIFTKRERERSLISDGRAPDPTGWVETEKGTIAVITPINPAEEMEARNLYVACFTNEPLQFLASYLGPDHLILGTDMGHNDGGTDPLAHSYLMERTDIDVTVRRKICDDNARRAYGIPRGLTLTGAQPRERPGRGLNDT